MGSEWRCRAIQKERNRGFVWTGELADVLAEYEAHRDRYLTLESFSPRLIAFFSQYANSFEKEQAALDAKRPRLTSMVPANGAERVDPALKEIRLTFDRPMQAGSWSLVGGWIALP